MSPALLRSLAMFSYCKSKQIKRFYKLLSVKFTLNDTFCIIFANKSIKKLRHTLLYIANVWDYIQTVVQKKCH